MLLLGFAEQTPREKCLFSLNEMKFFSGHLASLHEKIVLRECLVSLHRIYVSGEVILIIMENSRRGFIR